MFSALRPSRTPPMTDLMDKYFPGFLKEPPKIFTEEERAILLDVYQKIFRGETVGTIDVAEFAVKQGEAQHAILLRDRKELAAFHLKGCFFCEVLGRRTA
jgi:hypothetical protein